MRTTPNRLKQKLRADGAPVGSGCGRSARPDVSVSNLSSREGRVTETANIRIGRRHRKQHGDLKLLADSIAAVGLLQPIGITEDSELVFGERRLLACRDILGLRETPTRTINLRSIVEGEFHENEVRKDFTPSERVRDRADDRKGTGQSPGAED